MNWLELVLAVAILVLPFLFFWIVTSRKRMPKSEDNNHAENMHRYTGGGVGRHSADD